MQLTNISDTINGILNIWLKRPENFGILKPDIFDTKGLNQELN